MALTRTVISTLQDNGVDVMGPDILAFHYPSESIVSGSLLTVEANHFAVLKSRGAILNTYETGQFAVSTPDKPLLGSFTQAFFSGQSPWQYEVLYINRAKLLVKANGVATTREMAEVDYVVDFYIHVDSPKRAVDLITHMPFAGHYIKSAQIADYAAPVIEQAINSVIQVTPLEEVNEKIADIIKTVETHLQEFLTTFGISLHSVKVLVTPRDARMKELIALRAFGMSEHEAARFYLALEMAKHGLVSAPNAMIGQPYQQASILGAMAAAGDHVRAAGPTATLGTPTGAASGGSNGAGRAN